MNDGCGEVDDGGEAFIGFVGAGGDALELFDAAEEVLDEVAPTIHGRINNMWFRAPRMLCDDSFGAACVELLDDPVTIVGHVGNQRVEVQVLDKRRNADGIKALPRQEREANKVAKGVGEGNDFGRWTPFGPAYGLTRSPPFAP